MIHMSEHNLNFGDLLTAMGAGNPQTNQRPTLGGEAPPRERTRRMSFTNQQPFKVTQQSISGFTSFGRRFNCKLCGHVFALGDMARWVYANGGGSPVRCGNFFVCEKCDGPNDAVLKCAKTGFEQAVKLAKQWEIYGPEWQKDVL